MKTYLNQISGIDDAIVSSVYEQAFMDARKGIAYS